MSLVTNIISLLVLIVPPFCIWYLYEKKKRIILLKPAETTNQKTNRNITLNNAKIKYTSLFSKVTLGVLLSVNIVTIGESIMNESDKKLTVLSTNLQNIEKGHGKRLKDIEDFLFPPGGPSSPAVFQRIDNLEKSRKEIENLLLRLSDPNPELERKVHELEDEIRLIKLELKKIQGHKKTVQRGMRSSM